jgi:hypothetical protein
MFLLFLKRKHVTRLNDRTEEENPLLIRDRRALLISIILLSLIVILNIRYPGAIAVAEWLFQLIGLPTSSGENGMGLQFVGLFNLSLIIVVLFCMNRALSRGKFIALIVIMTLIINAPDWLTTSYQRFFASGVYAVEVNETQSSCNYVIKDRKLTGTCQLPLKNYSRDVVEIVPVISFPKYWRESEMTLPEITLPSVLIQPHAEWIHHADFNVEMDNHQDIERGGSFFGVIISLSDGVHERKWELK